MKTVLEEAEMLVNGDRAKEYGSVLDNFQDIAELWTVIIGAQVTPEQVALCMVQLKIARQLYKPKRDNLVDAAGYLACYEKLETERNEPKGQIK